MPSERLSAALRETRPSRRRCLATLGAVASVSIAGCSGGLSGSDPSSGDESSEVVVVNQTDSEAEIAVRVIDGEGETRFSRVFSLGAGKTKSSRDVLETTPERVHAFTADGVSRSWRYAPDLPVDFDCEPKDIGLTLHRDDGIEPWYDC